MTAQTESDGWPVKPEVKQSREQSYTKVADWNNLLGWGMYGLDVDKEKYSPSFRGLVSYDVRRIQFLDPFALYPGQRVWETQVLNAYMLDLNWGHAVQQQFLRDRSNSVKNIMRELRNENSLLTNIVGTVGELEYEKEQLRQLAEKTRADLEKFRVHPQYEQLEEEADLLTTKLHDIANHILQLKRLIEFHARSVDEEKPADDIRVRELYEEAGMIFPQAVIERLDDVRSFHLKVTENRRVYLENEAKRLQDELRKTMEEQERLSVDRAELMQLLESHRALDEYNRWQALNLKQFSDLEDIERQLKKRKQIDNEKAEIKMEQALLTIDARRDLDERDSKSLAAKIFNESSKYLYDEPGAFIVEINTKSGFKFSVDIKRSDSSGVSKMKVFCYDLTRAELWSRRNVAPGFLIHDSTLFDGVDERQVAKALELAESKSRECGFQYIVCLNSDNLPSRQFSEHFDLDKFVRLRLTDHEPSGRLLGIEY